MAANPPIVPDEAWELALSQYQKAKHKVQMEYAEGITPQNAAVGIDRMNELHRELLRLPAPHISAVIQKLHLIWEEVLFEGTEQASEKQRIIGDLHRLDFEWQTGESATGEAWEPSLS